MGARPRMPPGVPLACLAVGIAAIGALAVAAAGVSAARADLTGQADAALRTCAGGLTDRGFTVVPGAGAVSGQMLPGACDTALLTASGQPLVAAACASRPAIPASGSWLAAHLRRPVTVPGTSAGGSWRVAIEPVRYQPQRMLFVYGPDDVKYLVGRHGTRGMLVIAAPLPGLGPVAGRYAAAAAAVLLLLAAAALAVVRMLLSGGGHPRPFGQPPASMAERAGASGPPEAAALPSAAEMARRLGEASMQLRRSVAVVRGFAEYCTERGVPPPAELGRMMRRVADETARMEALVADLGGRQAAGRPGGSG